MLDLVTVTYDDRSELAEFDLRNALSNFADGLYSFTSVSNRKENVGFAKACNMGARRFSNPIVGFLNPDVRVRGAFLKTVERAFRDPQVVIAGNRFGMPPGHLELWGVSHWVCGACMFVRRSWFTRVNGFDERYFLNYEETDLCRMAETMGLTVCELDLPIDHTSPTDDPKEVLALKAHHIERSWELYQAKWGIK